MEKKAVIVLVLGCVVCFMGCGKKKDIVAGAVSQEPMSIEALSSADPSQTAVAESKSREVKILPDIEAQSSEPSLESLPPQGPYSPTVNEIQTALVNAGFYTGKVDGKIGPKTKKAVGEFQKTNGLEADGKVGPKTWSVLSKHLTVDSTIDAMSVAKKKK